jgi:hypothetical protein
VFRNLLSVSLWELEVGCEAFGKDFFGLRFSVIRIWSKLGERAIGQLRDELRGFFS